jgi:hypothetical protein
MIIFVLIFNFVIKQNGIWFAISSNPGTYSTSNDPECHEDISEVDKFVVKLWKEHHEHKDHALAARLDKEAH